MSSTSIQEAILCFAPKLRQWYRNREGDPNIGDDDIDLNTVTALYGKDKLLKEYEEVQNASEALMDYDKGVSDVNFDKLFTLNQIEERHSVMFTHTRTVYDVQVAPLMKHFDNFQSMIVLPKLFESLLKLCSSDFQPLDRMIIHLSCADLDPSIYLHVHDFKYFNIHLLLAQTEKLNSSKKFKIDKSFRLRVDRVQHHAGGGRRLNIHTTVDRNRISKSLVTVHVGSSLCLPAALFIGKFRLTHDVQQGQADYRSWENLVSKRKVVALEYCITSEFQRHNLPVGRKYDLSDIDAIQRTLYPKFQIVVLSACHANTVISRSPSVKRPGME